MSHVDYVDDKWSWYLRLEYGVRTVVAYLTFGGTLGMVQYRHAVMQRRLRWRSWRKTYLKALPADDNDEDNGNNDGVGSDEAVTAHALLQSLLALDVGGVDALDEDARTRFWRFYWQPLLAEFNDVVGMTHGEAVNVRLLGALERQADMLAGHVALRRKQRHASDTTGPLENREEDEDEDDESDGVFVMSKTDRASQAQAKCTSAAPPRLRYGDAVRLTYVLSEIMASELHCLRQAESATPAPPPPPPQPTSSTDADPVVSSTETQAPSIPALPPVEPSCVALMLPNSVEYNSIWLACARAGPLQTLLSAVHNEVTQPAQPLSPLVYRPCATALINTNLVSNAMLFHALECAGSAVFVTDPQYASLLFAAPQSTASTTSAAADGDGGESLGPIHVPPCVKRIFFWRLGDGDDAKQREAVGLANLTAAMRTAIERFNMAVYDAARVRAKAVAAAVAATTDDRAVSRPVLMPLSAADAASETLELDLWAVVKPHYNDNNSNTPSPAVATSVSGPRRRAWKRFHWVPLLSAKVLSWYAADIAHLAGNITTTTAEDATGTGRESLVALYKTTAPSLCAALMRFKITEPVLYIYTSGTTGLPKAARFSHLRFFATAFLSRLLSMRDATRRVLREQAKERAATTRAATAAYGNDNPLAANTSEVNGVHTPDKAAQNGKGAAGLSYGTMGPTGVVDDDDEQSIHQNDGEGAVAGGVDPAFLASLDRRTHVTRHSRLIVTLLTIWSFIRCMFAWVPFILGLTRRRHYSPEELHEEQELAMLTIYNALPMYHTVGCVFCLGHLLHALEEQQARQETMRSTWREPYFAKSPAHQAAMPLPTARMVIRLKYSASNFQKDLEFYHATVTQYIGEILRYSVLFERHNAPQAVSQLGNPTAHALPADLPLSERALLSLRNQWAWRVPYAFGNGLRLDIWTECMDRLNVAQPVEFYSSTEGNIFLFNLFNIPGAIGHLPRLGGRYMTVEYLPFFPFRVLRFDEVTQEVWRDPVSGYCSRVAVGEAGEVCGEVVQGFDMFALRRFDGYHHSRASATGAPSATTDADVQTNRKLMRHVMWPNKDDLFFRSGDLIKFDADGFCFFVDRVGETYRWKGENVSTLEVSNALNTVHSTHVGILEAVVYGVSVPGREGRAGMVMLTLQPRAFHAAARKAEAASDADADTSVFDSATKKDRTSLSGSPSSSLGLPLEAERRFLQNDLYRFVSGQNVVNGDGSASQAALPAYAIPLFIRMAPEGHGGAAGVGKDSRDASMTKLPTLPNADEKNGDDDDASTMKNKKTKSGSGGGHGQDQHSHLRTSTFKYIKHLLVKEGYEAGLKASIHDRCWQSDDWGDQEEDCEGGHTSPPQDRYYVLVTNPAIYSQLCLPSKAEANGGEGEGKDAASPSLRPRAPQKGYVPLTRETIALVGETFDKCGW